MKQLQSQALMLGCSTAGQALKNFSPESFYVVSSDQCSKWGEAPGKNWVSHPSGCCNRDTLNPQQGHNDSG